MSASRTSSGKRAAECWRTDEEIARLEGVSRSGITKKLDRILMNANGTRGLYERRVENTRGGGAGGFIRQRNLVAIARDFPGSLKACTAERAEDAEETQIVVTSDAILAKPAAQLSETLPLFGTGEAERVALGPEDEDQARERLAVIQPLIDFLARPRAERALLRFHGRAFEKSQELAAWLATEQFSFTEGGKIEKRRVPTATIWRWYMRWKEGGFHALANRTRRDRGESKLFGRVPAQLPDDAAGLERELAKLTPAGRFLAKLHLVENYSIRMAAEALENCVAQGGSARFGLERAPGMSTVHAFLSAFPPVLRDGARLPAKQWHARHAPTARRDFTTARVNEWWVLDHAQDDFFVYNDFIEKLDRYAFLEHPANAWLRMWLTAFMDVRSRLIVGYAFCATPSSTSIGSALRMGILRTGRAPRFGLLDRGEDMKKVGKEKPAMPAAAQGVLTRLIREQWGESGGIVFSIGEHPQSKPIESWFKTKRNRFDSLVRSYAGNAPGRRPDVCQELLNQHERWMKAPSEGVSPLPPASLAVRATVAWIEEHYNRGHRHTGQGMNRRTPYEVFRLGYPAAQEKAAVEALDARALEEFLWDRKPRMVSRGGCVQMYNAEYEPADAASLATLRCWDGREVLVGADPHNVGDAVASDPETGERLGALVSKKLQAWGESQGTIRARMRAQRHARKATEQYIALLGARPAEPFAFLGAGFEQGAAAQPVPALNSRALAPARAKQEAASPFVSDAVRDFLDSEGEK